MKNKHPGKFGELDVSNWRDRSVLVTGHTGFKGGWLSLWLNRLGAEVHGISLEPPTTPGLYEVADLRGVMASDVRADIRNSAAMLEAMERARPSVLFHLAAQPLVIDGYTSPIETFDVNVLGTARVLEAVRSIPSIEAVVVITTDKVYDNREWVYPYRENDALGGYDPYSASKGAAEIVAASYRASFFGDAGHTARIATARAGNVIGGGDWAANRLVPDCVRAFQSDGFVQLRYPQAIRPWQHVLDPLSGYIQLASQLLGDRGGLFAEAWNFGPDTTSDASVGEVARLTCRFLGDEKRYRLPDELAPLHEAGILRLDSTKAKASLGWAPRWGLEDAVAHSVNWYKAWSDGDDMRAFSERQIDIYQAAAS